MIMNKENMQKWVAALRSGDYTQARSVLRKKDTNEMCCLGVLCDLYTKANDDGKWIDKTDVVDANSSTLGQVFNYEGSEFVGMPPRDIIAWSGLSVNRYDSFWGALAESNDTGSTFEEIADKIEAKFNEQEQVQKALDTCV
jgi:hypothetical protein